MKCPKCGQEMNPGFLQAGNMMSFNKHIHKLSINPKDKEDVAIASNTFRFCNFSGFICRDCGLVTFDYTNTQAKE